MVQRFLLCPNSAVPLHKNTCNISRTLKPHRFRYETPAVISTKLYISPTHCTCFACFLPFNDPCQFTPLLNLRPLIFCFRPCGWICSITLPRPIPLLVRISFLIYNFFIYAHFFRKGLNRPQREVACRRTLLSSSRMQVLEEDTLIHIGMKRGLVK